MAERRYRLSIKALVIAIQTDQDPSIDKTLQDFIQSLSIDFEQSSIYTLEQNGAAEQSREIIITKARYIYINIELSEDLQPEVYLTVYYLSDRTPNRSLNQDSLLIFLQKALGKQIHSKIAHLYIYRYKAYVLIKGPIASKKSEKLQPRIFAGYLIGYNSTNIYRIWNLTIYTVKGYRDVIFNKNKRYHTQAELPVRESEPYLQYMEIPLPKYLTTILDTDNDLLSLLPSQRDREYNPGSNQPPPLEPSLSSKPTTLQILTPPSTIASTPTLSHSQSQQPEPSKPKITTQTQQAPLDMLQPNVSAKPRQNMPRPDYYQLNKKDKEQANYIVLDNNYLNSVNPDLYLAFSAAVATVRPHRDHLSPLSILQKALRLYLYAEGFIAAA